MKVTQFIIVLTFFGFTANSQYVDRTSFRAGLNAGIVTGDFSEAYSLVLGLDLYQHWGISKTIDLGITTGFSNAFGEKQEISAGGALIETKFDNIQFIPVAGSVRFYPTTGVKFGGDVGYAIGVNEGNEGGFYYRPSLGIDLNNGTTELNVSYLAVNGDIPYNSVLFGLLFLF
ncbi:hypothetical protein ACFQZJ_06375 [Maribacter chungangensis]|uniref:Outer membrane protein beta-barrel domain-containing protein n=1 Tax=Maribacter chungangensis TaxID=1069117 RepID=A0ABW3B1I6_9FLAO